MSWRSAAQVALSLGDRFTLPARVQRLAFPRDLAIIMYHGVVHDPLPFPDWCFVGEDQFAEQVRYLARETHVLPMHTAVERMRSGALKYPTVAITFDDGFQSVHDIALPILEELSLPATVFLATSFIDTPRTIWFCELIQLLSMTSSKELSWRGERHDLGDTGARAATSARLQAILKELDAGALRDALREIAQALGMDSIDAQETHTSFRMLDRPSIERMTRSGLIEFGAHTESHPILTRVSPERAATEIQRSVERTAELAGAPCRLFAYPNGRTQDYDEVAMAAVRRAGISSAVTTVAGPNTGRTPGLELRRYGVGGGDALARFQIEVHHLRSHLSRSG